MRGYWPLYEQVDLHHLGGLTYNETFDANGENRIQKIKEMAV